MEYLDIRKLIVHLVSVVGMKRVESFLTALLQLTMTFSMANSSAATCLKEQVESCRQAAMDSKVGELAGGGACKPSAYVHYTHECKVQDYLPSIDFCCCQLEAKVMCCRYHQDWDRFRCSEADDTIDQAQVGITLPLPLELFVPAVVGPVLLAICCIFCCTKCLCHRHDTDDEDGTDCFSCCSSKTCSRCCSCSSASCCCSRCCRSDDDERGSRQEKNGGPSPDEQLPLTNPHLMHQNSQQSQHVLSSLSSVEGATSNGSHAKLLHMSLSTGSRAEPTAPPPLLMDDVYSHNNDITLYGGSLVSQSSGGFANNNPGTHRPSCTDSSNVPSTIYSSSPQHRLCASCSNALIVVPPLAPPPPYEESPGQRTEST